MHISPFCRYPLCNGACVTFSCWGEAVMHNLREAKKESAQMTFTALSVRIDYRPGGFSPLYSANSLFYGTAGGNRTRTGFLPQDFKSRMSTNSITAACKTVQFLSALTDTVSRRSVFNAVVSIHSHGRITSLQSAHLGLTDPTEHLLSKRHWRNEIDLNYQTLWLDA